MYEIILSVIKNQDYKLEDILKKIETMWIESKINDEQKDELIEKARENAVPENSYATINETVERLIVEVEDLKKRVLILEGNSSEQEEEYPEFVQPTGAHDCYNQGDKVTFKEKKYICKINNCVWDPETYPAGWEEVK